MSVLNFTCIFLITFVKRNIIPGSHFKINGIKFFNFEEIFYFFFTLYRFMYS